MSCGVCGEDLPKDGLYIECKGCDNELHYRCANLSAKSYKSMGEAKRLAWRCRGCRGSVGGEDKVSSDLQRMFDELKRDLETSQEFLAEKYEQLFAKLEETNKVMSTMSTTIKVMAEKLKEKDDIIEDLSARVNHLEQYGRKCNIEFTGVKVEGSENLPLIVLNAAKKMDINIDESHIETVHRLPAKNGKIPNIIVEFSSRKVRDEFINKKNTHVIKCENLVKGGGNERVFVNENLSPYYKSLFWKTKNVAKEKKYKYVWFKYGKILVKKGENDVVIRITRDSDLKNIV